MPPRSVLITGVNGLIGLGKQPAGVDTGRVGVVFQGSQRVGAILRLVADQR